MNRSEAHERAMFLLARIAESQESMDKDKVELAGVRGFLAGFDSGVASMVPEPEEPVNGASD